MARSPAWLSVAEVRAALPEIRRQGVSAVARSPRGFIPAYTRAMKRANLSQTWKQRRGAFVARHMAQVRHRDEPLWVDGEPTRRHLALVAWAYSPTPTRLRRWLHAR